MSNLYNSLYKLAQKEPGLRKHLVPILRLAQEEVQEEEAKSKKKGPPPRWAEFLAEKYEGGKKTILNPNQKTRKKFQWVTVNTALKDDVYRAKVMEEYAKWIKENPDPKKAPKKEPEKEDQKKEAPKEEAPKKETPKKEDAKKEFAKPLEASPTAYMEFGDMFKLASLKKEHIKALTVYSSNNYTNVNGHLRRGEPTEEELKELGLLKTLKDLEAAFETEAAVVPKSVVVTRGVSLMHPLSKLAHQKLLVPGMEIEDKGYVSTSVMPPTEWEWGGGYKLHVTVPKGTKGIYMAKTSDGGVISEYPNEWELLLNRGTKMRVTKIDGTDIHVEVIT